MAASLRQACLSKLVRTNKFILCQNGYPALQIHLTVDRCRALRREEDFFGIHEDENEKSIGEHRPHQTLENERETEQLTRERQKLLQSLQKTKPGKEVIAQTVFGQIRLDGRTKHSKFGNVNAEDFLRSISGSSRKSDPGQDEALGKVKTSTMFKGKIKKNRKTEKGNMNDNKVTHSAESNMNYFDQQYFQAAEMFQQNENVLESHGHLEVSLSRSLSDEQKDMTGNQHIPEIQSAPEMYSSEVNKSHRPSTSTRESSDSFIDQAYFPTLTKCADSSITENSVVDSQASRSHRNNDIIINADAVQNQASSESYIDQLYFPDHYESQPSVSVVVKEQISQQTESGLSPEQFPENGSTPSVHGTSEHSPALDSFDQSIRTSDPLKGVSDHTHRHNAPSQTTGTDQTSGEEEFSFIDAQYFEGDRNSPGQNFVEVVNHYVATPNHETVQELSQQHKTQTKRNELSQQHNSMQTKHKEQHTTQTKVNEISKQHKTPVNHSHPTTDSDSTDTHGSDNIIQSLGSLDSESSMKKEKVFRPKEKKKEAKVEDSAFDAAMELRKSIRLNLTPKDDEAKKKKRGKIDMYKSQVPDLSHMPAMEVVQLLADSVVYENEDFIAVSKPYGLPSHGGPGVRVSVGQVLNPLSSRLDQGRGKLDGLHLIHRLDKETTGVMLLAKTAEVAWQLLGMFRRREVAKTYWTITKGLPQPLQGQIDIPLAREEVNGVFKTVVKPRQYIAGSSVKTETWNRRGDNSSQAVTEYSVLAHRDGMALVECRPLTGVQHQIRAHLAQALNTPVLGDHKYSHMDRLAPQKLFPEALQKMGIRQAQVRYVPMHLHAKGLMLPEWRGQSNIFIKAAVPRFFLKNLKTLKIQIPPR